MPQDREPRHLISYEASGNLRELFGHSLDNLVFPGQREMFLNIVDSYQPWHQVVTLAEPNTSPLGFKLDIVDRYGSPSQTGQAPQLDPMHIPGGYIPMEIQARTPASAVFTFFGTDEHGHLTVEEFNAAEGANMTHNPYSAHKIVTQEWQRRMGVKNSNSKGLPYFDIGNIGTFEFSDLYYDSGTGRFGHIFWQKDIMNMGYAGVLLAHHLPIIPEEQQREGFFASVQHYGAGHEESAKYVLALQNTTHDSKYPHFKFLTQYQQVKPMLEKVLPLKEQKILAAIPESWLDQSSIIQTLICLERAKAADKTAILQQLPNILKYLPPLRGIPEENQALIAALQADQAGDEEFYRLLYTIMDFGDASGYCHDQTLMPNYGGVSQAVQAKVESITTAKVCFADSDDSIGKWPKK